MTRFWNLLVPRRALQWGRLDGVTGRLFAALRQEGAVFVEPYSLESNGHVGAFHSDEQRFSFCYCSCGWSNDTPDAHRMVDLWRSHLDPGPTEGQQ